MLSRRPRKEKSPCLIIENEFNTMDEIFENNKNMKKKYFDENECKAIWDFAVNSTNFGNDNENGDGDENENENGNDSLSMEYKSLSERSNCSLSLDAFGESTNMCNADGDQCDDNALELNFDFDCDGRNGMEWKHMYPVRKSVYNRKSHFLSFIQNYTSAHLGRKLMSEYEQTMCDFIMKNMKPSTDEEFLMMLRGCKLSNVYRYYEHIFNSSCSVNNCSVPKVDIVHEDIDRIYTIFSSFQSFFHRQNKFNRKNFLSMRFILGRILLYLKIVDDKENLPTDLKRPKGKSQLEFHEQVWSSFLQSLH